MGRVIAVANQKGGVGKSTTAINLSACLAEKEKKVLTIDMDPQGNTTSGLGVDKNNVENTLYELLLGEAETKNTIVKDVVENVDLIPSNVNLSGAEIELIGVDEKEYILKKIIDKVRRKYDYIIIDCGLKQELLTVNALSASDYCIIPVQSHFLASEGIPDVLDMVHSVQKHFNPGLKIAGILLTMYQSRPQLCKSVQQSVREVYGDDLHVFDRPIEYTIWFRHLPGLRQPYMGIAESAGSHLHQQRIPFVFMRLRSNQKRNHLLQRS